ncbi:hypothetical protein Ae201684P_022515 [Aphanomyces euteiches]|nr:hypothetical protein Ae201684P_022515 [Aphanomyces euteiches]
MSLLSACAAHSCGVDGGWYATTGIGLALQRKFQSKTPAAVKRDPPKVVGPRPAVNPPNVVDFHMLLVVQLLAVLFTATVAVWQRLPSFGRRMSKVEQPTRDPPVSKGKLVPSWNRPSIQRCKRARRATPLAPMDDVQVVNLLLR